MNGTFYSLQRPGHFDSWYDETPAGFVFSVKGSRFVTHMRRLLNAEVPLANFFAQGVLRLRDKLGPVLWQLPPNFKCDLERLDQFFSLLPRTHKQAAQLARQHDERLNGRAWFAVKQDHPLRHAIEIRHESFVREEFIALLRKHRVGLVVADTVEWPLLMDITAPFVYCRLHGSEQLYASGYDSGAIDQWARRVIHWSQGREAEDGRKASSRKPPRGADATFTSTSTMTPRCVLPSTRRRCRPGIRNSSSAPNEETGLQQELNSLYSASNRQGAVPAIIKEKTCSG